MTSANAARTVAGGLHLSERLVSASLRAKGATREHRRAGVAQFFQCRRSSSDAESARLPETSGFAELAGANAARQNEFCDGAPPLRLGLLRVQRALVDCRSLPYWDRCVAPVEHDGA